MELLGSADPAPSPGSLRGADFRYPRHHADAATEPLAINRRGCARRAFYYINWRFALNSVDYMAAESAASPVQHYWSLSIEEQFYVVLPLLIIAMIVAFRVFGKRKLAPKHLIVMLVPIVMASFLWSVHYTSVAAAPAYFVSTTRAWEMGVGSILALAAAGGIRLAHRPCVFLAGLGVVMIIGAAIWFTPATPYPGSAALLPVLGAVLVILAGTDAGRGPIPIMTSKPAQFIGDISYSLYLWHWPIVVFLPAFIRPRTPSETLAVGVAAVVLSVIPAYLSYRFVEKPIHKSPKIAAKKWSAPIVLAACLLVAIVCAGVLSLNYQQRLGAYDVAAGDAPGAAVLGLNEDEIAYELTDWPTDELVPNPAEAKSDRQRANADGCHLDQASTVPVGCQVGPLDSDTSVVLIGDSHAAQWQTALDLIAIEEGWNFTTYTKSACLWADTEVWNTNYDGAYSSCTEWANNLTDMFTEQPPDIILFSFSVYEHVSQIDDPTEVLADGVIRALEPVLAAGAKLVMIADTPRMSVDPAECAEINSDELDKCSVGIEVALDYTGHQLQHRVVDYLGAEAAWIDMNPWICPGGTCHVAVG